MIRTKLKNIFSSQLRLNMLSGPISTGVGIVVSAVKFPLYLHFLGYEHYGAWLLLSTILTFAQMGLLGIAPAITKLVAEEYGQKNYNAIQEYFTSALCMVLIVGAFLITISILFKWQIVAVMGIEKENSALVGKLLVYMVIFSTGVLAYQVLNSVLAGIGRIDIANYSQTALKVLPLLVSIPLLMGGKGVIGLLFANAFAYFTIFIFNLIRVNQIISISIRRLTFFSKMRLRKLIAFGLPLFSGAILNMSVVPITKIAITRFIGLEGVPIFELAYQVSMQVRGLFEVALRALMPEISKLSAKPHRKNALKIKGIISKSYKILFYGAIPTYAVIFLFSNFIFKIWLGKQFAPTIPSVFKIMLIASAVSLIGVIPYYMALGLGEIKTILIHRILTACGTLLTIWIVIGTVSPLEITTIMWCFVVGATLGTGYLLYSASSEIY